jgi:hypothetical protein
MQSARINFPVSWQLEGKNESDNWILIDTREKVQEMEEKDKLIVLNLQKEMLISSLRLTILNSTGKYGFWCLKSFELFGAITHNDFTFQELLTKPIKMDIVTPITFNFSITSQLGLFHFFQQFSMKDRSDVFEIFSYHTKPSSTSQNLLFWNDEEWQAEYEYSSVSLYIDFGFPFIFKLTGYRFRSGKSKFLKNWEVIGYESDHGKGNWKETHLDEQKENRDLARSGAEKSFKINCEKFFDEIQFELKEKSEGEAEFNLAGLELFGILAKVQ